MWTRFSHQGSSTVRLRHEIQMIWPRYWRFRHKKTRSPRCDFESSESLMACFHKPRRALLAATAASADGGTAGGATGADALAANLFAADFTATNLTAANFLHFAAGRSWLAARRSWRAAGRSGCWCTAGGRRCRSTRVAGGSGSRTTTAGRNHLNTTTITGRSRGEAAAGAATTTGPSFAKQTSFCTRRSHNSCQAKDQQHGKDVFHSCSPCNFLRPCVMHKCLVRADSLRRAGKIGNTDTPHNRSAASFPKLVASHFRLSLPTPTRRALGHKTREK